MRTTPKVLGTVVGTALAVWLIRRLAHGPVRTTAVDPSTLASDKPAMAGTRHS